MLVAWYVVLVSCRQPLLPFSCLAMGMAALHCQIGSSKSTTPKIVTPKIVTRAMAVSPAQTRCALLSEHTSIGSADSGRGMNCSYLERPATLCAAPSIQHRHTRGISRSASSSRPLSARPAPSSRKQVASPGLCRRIRAMAAGRTDACRCLVRCKLAKT